MSERRAARGDGEAVPGAAVQAAGKPASDGGRPGEEGVVVRDKRKVNSGTAKTKPTGQPDGSGAGSADRAESAAESTSEPTAERADAGAQEPGGGATDGGQPASTGADAQPGAGEPAAEVDAGAEAVPAEAEPAQASAAGAGATAPPAALGAELEALRSELEERTSDLQRITAEYANYRKRVDRDRGLVVEQATGSLLAVLLPILDDLDRAREHGDLTGPFGAVAEQLTTALGKFGLAPFGEKGDPFDPTRHEAVAHQTSPEVTEPTCVDVMRRGYLLGDRLLRPALVAVADPE